MPATSTPITVLPTGKLKTTPKPLLGAGTGQAWSVIVGNYSTAVLKVTAPGYSGTVVPAFSQATFSAESGPINFAVKGALAPGASATSASGYVVLTWRVGPEVKTGVGLIGLSPTIVNLGPGSTVKIGTSVITITGTVSLAAGTSINVGTVASITEIVNVTKAAIVNFSGTLIQTGDLITVLATHGAATASKTWSFSKSTPTHTYGAVLIRVLASSGGPPLCVRVVTNFTGIGLVAPFANSLGGYIAIVPFFNEQVGTTLTFTVYFTVTSTGTAYAYGLTSNPGVNLRSDGRTYPIGAHSLTHNVTTGAILVPAPPPPLRILLKRMNGYFISATKLAMALEGTINGVSALNLATTTSTQPFDTGDLGAGTLLDIGTGLGIGTTGAPTGGSGVNATFDWVV